MVGILSLMDLIHIQDRKLAMCMDIIHILDRKLAMYMDIMKMRVIFIIMDSITNISTMARTTITIMVGTITIIITTVLTTTISTMARTSSTLLMVHIITIFIMGRTTYNVEKYRRIGRMGTDIPQK